MRESLRPRGAPSEWSNFYHTKCAHAIQVKNVFNAIKGNTVNLILIINKIKYLLFIVFQIQQQYTLKYKTLKNIKVS